MTERFSLLPDEVQRTVTRWFGERGRAWCDALPELLARLVERWQLTVGPVLPGATHALVLDCRRADGTPVVLKLPFLDDENRAEADALRLYDGNGAVRLLEHDEAKGALLLERLVPGTSLLDLSDRGRALDLACSLLRRLRRQVPRDHRFPRLRDLAAAWATDIADRKDQVSTSLFTKAFPQASEFAGDYASNSRDTLLVNRDTHLSNFLAAGREPWLLIDPKPVAGEAAFDGSFLLLRNLADEPTPVQAAALTEKLAAGLAVDAVRLRGWALVRAVDNVIWAADLDDRRQSATWLAKAQTLAAMD